MDSFQNIAGFLFFFFFNEEQCIEFWGKNVFCPWPIYYVYIYACLNIHTLSLEKNKNLLKFIWAKKSDVLTGIKW